MARSERERTVDRTLIADLYIQGVPQHEIAQRLSTHRPYRLTIGMVAHDIEAIRTEWKASRLWAIDDMVARELGRLDYLEKQAWEAWHDSRKEFKETIQHVKPDPSRNNAPYPVGGMVTTRPGTGDSRYLDVVLKCSQERSKLLGLYTAQKHDVTVRAHGLVGVENQDLSRLDDHDLQTEIDRLTRIGQEQQIVLDDVLGILDQPPENTP